MRDAPAGHENRDTKETPFGAGGCHAEVANVGGRASGDGDRLVRERPVLHRCGPWGLGSGSPTRSAGVAGA